MADIFISYSRQTPEPTVALANDLKARGYTVWWDTEGLATGDEFPKAIRDAIRAAKAAIVIWTPASVNSEWVYAEASEADRSGKLVPVRTQDLDPADIPLPFSVRHTDLVSDRDKIYAALEKRGVLPAGRKPPPKPETRAEPKEDTEPEAQVEPALPLPSESPHVIATHWDFAKQKNDPREVRRFIQRYPRSNLIGEAMKELEELAWARLSENPSRDGVARFLNEFPNSPRRVEAHDLDDWLDAQDEDTQPGYEAYIAKWGDGNAGKYLQEAVVKLHELLELEARLIRTFTGHKSSANSVAFSPDGRLALSGSDDKTLKLWEVATGKEIRTFIGHNGSVNSVAFSPNGRVVLSGSADNTIKLWEVATGNEIRSFTGHGNTVRSVALSPDGRMALSGSTDKTLKLWEVASGREIRTFIGHSDWVRSVAFSPDGRLALSGSDDKTLKLWEVATGKEIRRFRGHGYGYSVLSVAFSPDGRLALSGSYDHTLKLWEVATGRKIRTFTRHSGWVRSVAFSSDGRLALSGSADNTIKLWEVATAKEIRSFKGHKGEVNSVAFSPDGRLALSGSTDKTLKLWDVSGF